MESRPPGIIQQHVHADISLGLARIVDKALAEDWNKALVYGYVAGYINDFELLGQFADDLGYEN